MDPPAVPDAIRVAIRCDRRLFRDALAVCLSQQPEFTVVGHVAATDDLLMLCDLRHADVVLFDAGTRLMALLDVLRTLRARFADTRVVVVYERLSPADLAAVWRVGLDTLVPCSHGLDALLAVMRQCAAATREHRARDRTAADSDAAAGLTDLEREIITLVGGGHTVGRIAELLEISTHAVENCKRRIYHKLGVVSQSHAVARATTLGIPTRLPAPGPTLTKAGVLLAVLRGPDGPARQRVVTTLLAHRIPFVVDSTLAPDEADKWNRWHPGPVVLVLVDPTPACWPGPEDRRAPIALVRTGPLRRANLLDTLSRGLVAVVSADRIPEDLMPALTLASRGHLVLAGTEGAALVGMARTWSTRADGGLPELTAREHDILRSIASGHTVRQTARSLGIAEKTVENTQARLFRKLGVRNRAGALATAHALGMLDPMP